MGHGDYLHALSLNAHVWFQSIQAVWTHILDSMVNPLDSMVNPAAHVQDSMVNPAAHAMDSMVNPR